MKSSNLSIIVESTPGLTPEEACNVRARALAFAFSCWRAKREDGSATTPRRAEDERNEEVSYVDHSTVETSNIVDHQFTKEKE